MERYNFSREEAEEFVRKSDHEREGLIHSIFHIDPNDWSLYDITLNSAHYTSGAVADIIVHAVEKMEKVPNEEQVLVRLKSMALAKRIETFAHKKLTSAVARHVEIDAEPGGVIKISGRIRNRKEKERLLELVSEYPGVTQVIDDLIVTELSFSY
jgi:hypothetical protein